MKKDGKIITIKTEHGDAVVQIIKNNGHWQYNCFCPPLGGAGFFALFSRSTARAVCEEAVKKIAEGAPYPEDTPLNDRFKGIGAIHIEAAKCAENRIKSITSNKSNVHAEGADSVSFGTPTVHQTQPL